jgi:hypothetical protein
MWEGYLAQRRPTGVEVLPAPRAVFLEGLRIGFEAAFLTILSLEENGGQVDASKVAPPDPVDPVGA